MALAATLAVLCGSVTALPALSAGTATLSTDRGCYLVGQKVTLQGEGFGAYRAYVVTIDGVYLGQRSTDGGGGFAIPIYPGGLPTGAAQHVDKLVVSDGTNVGRTTFTLTRRAGAQVIASRGNVRTLLAAFRVWGFATDGSPRVLYLHYVNPSGSLRKTEQLGTTGGQCGYLRTARRRLFPFSVSSGRWILQIDTSSAFSRRPLGPMTRIRVTIS